MYMYFYIYTCWKWEPVVQNLHDFEHIYTKMCIYISMYEYTYIYIYIYTYVYIYIESYEMGTCGIKPP